jgi:hypothetical protein
MDTVLIIFAGRMASLEMSGLSSLTQVHDGACRGDDGMWVGQLHLLFSYFPKDGTEVDAVLVRWLKKVTTRPTTLEAATLLDMYTWDTGRGRAEHSVDVIGIDTITGVACLQQHPKKEGLLFLNRFVA